MWSAVTFAEEIHNDIFDLAQSTWSKEIADRPTIGQLKTSLEDLLRKENARYGQARDVGQEVFKLLEAQRAKQAKISDRGGSVIRAKEIADAE